MTSDTKAPIRRVDDVKVLIQLVREYGFRGLLGEFHDADPMAVKALHRLLDSAEWLVGHVEDLEAQLNAAHINTKNYGG